jgi:ribosome recycling factor
MLYNVSEYQDELEMILIEFAEDIAEIRTGKATMETFNKIYVQAYGVSTPLAGVAKIVFETPINIKITPFDKSNKKEIVAALEQHNIGAKINDMGDELRLNFLPMTQEDRDAKIKELEKMVESYRIKMRLVRQEYMKKIKALEAVSEDEQKVAERNIQEDLDNYIKKLEEAFTLKKKELKPNN